MYKAKKVLPKSYSAGINVHNLLAVGLRKVLADCFRMRIDVRHQLRAELLRKQINDFKDHGGNLAGKRGSNSGPPIL